MTFSLCRPLRKMPASDSGSGYATLRSFAQPNSSGNSHDGFEMGCARVERNFCVPVVPCWRVDTIAEYRALRRLRTRRWQPVRELPESRNAVPRSGAILRPDYQLIVRESSTPVFSAVEGAGSTTPPTKQVELAAPSLAIGVSIWKWPVRNNSHSTAVQRAISRPRRFVYPALARNDRVPRIPVDALDPCGRAVILGDFKRRHALSPSIFIRPCSSHSRCDPLCEAHSYRRGI
jgi:hypothetical protein